MPRTRPACHRSTEGGGKSDPEHFRSVIEINLNGSYWAAQACARVMQPGSSIINISNVVGLPPRACRKRPTARSKAGVLGLTRDLAQQWGSRKGTRGNAVAPGCCHSEMTEQLPPGYIESPGRSLLMEVTESAAGSGQEASGPKYRAQYLPRICRAADSRQDANAYASTLAEERDYAQHRRGRQAVVVSRVRQEE
jgi:NAD(P)-dependent dehydrogenase (short-subunit alcohol dehydrogenase family)